MAPERIVLFVATGFAAFAVAALVFFYNASYNRAMVQCLEKHSQDVCVSTLR